MAPSTMTIMSSTRVLTPAVQSRSRRSKAEPGHRRADGRHLVDGDPDRQ
jgi:hypothetical protein